MLLALVFACAVLGELLSVAWHEARERRAAGRSALVAGALGLLHVPGVWLSIETASPVYLIADVVGQVVGSYVAVRALGPRAP